MGLLITRAVFFGVYIRAPSFGKLHKDERGSQSSKHPGAYQVPEFPFRLEGISKKILVSVTYNPYKELKLQFLLGFQIL